MLGYDLKRLITGQNTVRAIASPEELLRLFPELGSAS